MQIPVYKRRLAEAADELSAMAARVHAGEAALQFKEEHCRWGGRGAGGYQVRQQAVARTRESAR